MTEPFTGTRQYNKRAKRREKKKKHIRPSHSALLPGGTFGLCGEVRALYLATLCTSLNEKPFVAMVIPMREFLLTNNEALKRRKVGETFSRKLVEFPPVCENTNVD